MSVHEYADYDDVILIIGAGFAGSVIARELAEAGEMVQVIDKRDHVAGNAYDYRDEHGFMVHQYGPHLFHTKMKHVYDYLSRFTEWVPYNHRVQAKLGDGSTVTLPVNRETSNTVGKENVVDTFFRPYTKKMWDKDIEELAPGILDRVPVREDLNELYFPDDPYQGMPKDGYTELIRNMLDHPNIAVQLEVDAQPLLLKYPPSEWKHVFNSMPIDVFMNNRLGDLPYRSIKFHHAHVPQDKYQDVATVNFTHEYPWTRVTEWKHLPYSHPDNGLTAITFEEPCDYADNGYERYYPVKDVQGVNRDKYKQYRELVKQTYSNVTMIGRCGLYTYTDMDGAVAAALKTAQNYLADREL